MKYIDAIKQSMNFLAEDTKTIFLGYNISFGSQAYGTLKDIPKERKRETPVAENLMIGLATGLSLIGYRPLVFFERHDFMLNGLDAIVNHLDKIEIISENQFQTPVIIRASVGGTKPIMPGLQHIGDFTNSFKNLVSFPIYIPETSIEVLEAYAMARKSQRPTMIVEKRDLYNKED